MQGVRKAMPSCALLALTVLVLQVAGTGLAQTVDSALALPDKQVPWFELYDRSGQSRHASEFMAGSVVFASVVEGCSACDLLLSELDFVLRTTTPRPELVVIAPSLSDEYLNQIDTLLSDATVLFDPDCGVGAMFGVREAPTAYLSVDGLYSGLVPQWERRGGVGVSTDPAEMSESTSPVSARTVVRPGDTLPAVEGSYGQGANVVIRGFNTPTLLVFASEYCHSCVTAIEQLSELAETSSLNILIILVGSCGRILEETYGTRISVLCDRNGDTFSRFGVRATPTFVLACHDQVIGVWVGEIPSSSTSIDVRILPTTPRTRYLLLGIY